MLRLLIYSIILFIKAITFHLYAEQLQFHPRGEAALLINAETGAILFEYNAHASLFPASTTKLATALYAMKTNGAASLDDMIVADSKTLGIATQAEKRRLKSNLPAYCLEPDGSHIGIKAGEILSLRTLLEGLLISSGNDAANVIAEALGPTIPIFLDGMNDYLKSLGCQKTSFYNPHGLHDPKHQTTAFDLAIIAKEILRYPLLCEIISQKRFMRPKTNKQPATTYTQTNRLIRPGALYYAKAFGMKTGHHAKAKHTFVGAARSNDRTLIVVLLSYPERVVMFQDATLLFETAFNQPKVQSTVLKKGMQSFTYVLPNTEQPLQTYLQDSLNLEFYPAENPHAKCLLRWAPLTLPIVKDQQVGEIQVVSSSGQILKQTSLYAFNDVNITWSHTWLTRLSHISIIWLAACLLICSILLFIWQKKKRKDN